MSNAETPSPLIFVGRRLNRVPAKAAVNNRLPPHAFRGNQKPRGDYPSEQVVVDSGIFIAVGSAEAINGVERFGKHYCDRALTSAEIWDEITTKANSTERNKSLIGAAARRSQRYLLAMGRVAKRELDLLSSAALLQSVHTQLINLDAAQRAGTSPTDQAVDKHAGEAELITLAVMEKIPTILTNDAGASVVAASQCPAIRALHFADILMELICASEGDIDSATACATFEGACALSGILAEAKPRNSVAFFTCGQSGGPGSSCGRCT